MRRVTGDAPPAVGTYDLIVVDEAHRGYTLDRELADAELGWRNENEYVSKYRQVIEYFDAVKVALTATPALHTTEIFGKPVYAYTYRQAVLDGVLIDHEPPIMEFYSRLEIVNPNVTRLTGRFEWSRARSADDGAPIEGAPSSE